MSKSTLPAQLPRGFVSAQQVAEHAGVSRSAVSRAFTPGASIAESTREKVMRSAGALGYQVNDLARGLLANRSRIVGLVVTRPEVGFRAHLVAALTRALIRRGNVPVVINTGSSEDEIADAQSALLGHRAAATIILSGSPPYSFVEIAHRNGQQLVVIGRGETNCDHVQIDNAAAARHAAAMFAAKGMTRVAFAGSHSRTPNNLERESVFTEVARTHGLDVTAVHAPESDYAGGQVAARELFSGERRPQGVFCYNDPIALGLLDATRSQFGLTCPRDFSLIGFDDIPEASWDSYQLSTFRQDPLRMAEEAIRCLDRREERPDAPPISLMVEAPFVERQTS